MKISELLRESEELYVACIIDHNRSGQAVVRRSKPVSQERAEEIIDNALANNKFTNPPFMTIYPASAGRLDADTIMSDYPDMSSDATEAVVDEEPASRALCTSGKPDSALGASQLSSCKSQGYRSREGGKSHKIGHERVKVRGKRIKGKKYGGPLPDWS